MRAEQLAPKRRANLGLDSADDHLARAEAVEELHQEVVRLRGQLGDLDREHGGRATHEAGVRIQRSHLGSHHLPAVAGLVQDVGQHRRIEMLRDGVEVFGGEPVHASLLHLLRSG